MKCNYILLILLIVFSFSDAKSEIYTTTDGHKFEVSLIPDKHSILQNEPLYFSLEVKNLSETPIAFAHGGDNRNEFGRPNSFKVYVVGSDKKVIDKFPTRMNMGGGIGPIKILPNEKQTIRFLLAQWIKFEKPDNYIVFCEKDIAIAKYDKNSSISELLKAPSVKIKVDFQILVKPNNPKEMAQIIDSFGKSIFSPIYFKRSEAFKALRFVNDKLVIKYLVEAVKKDLVNDKNYEHFRYDIFQMLSKFDDKNAFNAIVKKINSPDTEIRRYVSIALSSSPYSKAEKYLLSMQTDSSDPIRLDVVHYLGRKKSKKSTEILKTMINDSSSYVRGEARRYLTERGEKYEN